MVCSKIRIFEDEVISLVKEINSVWIAFRETRDNELIPAVYAGKIERARELGLGIQKERYKEFVSLTEELVKKEKEAAKDLIEASPESI